MTAEELEQAAARIVAEEFGGNPVARVQARSIVDHDGEPIWDLLIVLKKKLPAQPPVLTIIRRINDFVQLSGDDRFVLVGYATVKEASERV